MSAFNEERRSKLPKDGSVWVDEGGNPYHVRYSTKYAVYCYHKGREACIKIGDFVEQMTPIEDTQEFQMMEN